ncbi:hypothetical protein IT418_02080 [bacterium]|nr:hypothetical protein [bacterium]
MTRKKRDDRGFSPAYEFALIVGRLLRDMFECRVSVCPELLVKVTDSEAQAKKNRKQRLLALSKSYVLKEVLVSEFIEGKPQIVCIVDDVLTTGATTTTILDQFSINTRLKAYLKTILLVRITFASA